MDCASVVGSRLHSFWSCMKMAPMLNKTPSLIMVITASDVCSVPQLKVCLSWKSRSSVGFPQLEIGVYLAS
jgi:hypothetical protein